MLTDPENGINDALPRGCGCVMIGSGGTMSDEHADMTHGGDRPVTQRRVVIIIVAAVVVGAILVGVIGWQIAARSAVGGVRIVYDARPLVCEGAEVGLEPADPTADATEPANGLADAADPTSMDAEGDNADTSATRDDTATIEAALASLAEAWAATPPTGPVPSPGRLAQLRRRYHELGASNPDAASCVDTVNDTIKFGAAHNLLTGDVVKYQALGGSTIGGLGLAGATYYVLVIDERTIRLVATQSVTNASDFVKSFPVSSVSGSTVTLVGHGLKNGTQVTYHSPAPLEFVLDGQPVKREVEARTTLLELLRLDLDKTGAKLVCDRGACGACMVLVNKVPRNACMLLAHDVAGAEVTTVAGLSQSDQLSPLQAAFVEHDALQCGFCTSGMLISATAVLEANAGKPLTREQVADGLAGNLCRCGTYPHVIDAVLAVANNEPAKRHGTELIRVRKVGA